MAAIGQLTVGEPRGRRRAAAGGGDRQLCGHLARPPHPDRAVLPHRLRADVPDRDRADARLNHRVAAGLTSRDAAMHKTGWRDRRWSALIRIYAGDALSRCPASRRDHRPAVLSARDSRHHLARPRQGRLRGHRHDLDPAAGAHRAAAAGRRRAAADPVDPGRHLVLDLPPRMERLEPEGAAAGRGGRRRRRLALCGPRVERLCVDHGRADRALLRALYLARQSADRSRAGRACRSACSGARSPASPRP